MFFSTLWQPHILDLKFQVRTADLEATDFLERRYPQCGTITRISPWHPLALLGPLQAEVGRGSPVSH